MKLVVEFRELKDVVSRMGADLSTWQPDSMEMNDLEVLWRELSEGKEIPLSEVEDSGGLLAYKGEQVVLYIKDTRQERDTLLYDKKNSRRFHVGECRTLDRMRREGRFERYVVTTRKDGLFLVEATDPYSRETEELEAKLGPCINCLVALNWRNYEGLNSSEKSDVWDNFSLDDFFAEYSTFFHNKPIHTDKTAPKGAYVRNWSRISDQIRREQNWCCENEKCGVDLSDDRRLLHCHHISGVVSDNRRENIKVLCVICHSEQPVHSRLKPNQEDRRRIEQLRLMQRMTADR